MIDIIGGGIGGLTIAIALEKEGIPTRIFEQTKKMKPAGAGIILAQNAMHVYERLGLRKEIEYHGTELSAMNITRADLSLLSITDLSAFEKKFHVKSIAIHRGTLQQILINALQNTPIKLHHSLNRIRPCKSGYELIFAYQKPIQSSTIIGADGIGSMVRQHLFPNSTIRPANQICWRGIAHIELPEPFQHQLHEAWGMGTRFGFVTIASNKVYWYALKSFKPKHKAHTLPNMETYFQKYHPIIKRIISTTAKEQIHTAEIAELKPINAWYKQRICLIGDAAHAMTPNLGQGACQAIEDAYFLSAYLAKYEPPKAFEKFQKRRLQKAHKVARLSRRIGNVGHISSPILADLRNLMMRLTPASVNRKQAEQMLSIPSL